MLMKQCSTFTPLPRLGDMAGHLSKVERVRDWKMAVESELACRHPLLKEYWAWSWQQGEAFYNTWLSFDRVGRATMQRTGPAPPRYAWVEDFFKPKLVEA